MTQPSPQRDRPSALIAVCALVSAVAICAALLLPGYLRDAPRRDADSILRSFLDDAVAGGDWRSTASELMQSVVPIGSPLRGENSTADALRLTVTYDAGDLEFSGDSAADSDVATAMVTLHYSYRILGERGSAAIPQKVWLTRPFYYDDDEPQRADADRRPSAVGPWRVTGITLPTANDLGESARGDYQLTSDARGAGDDVYCYSPAKALSQLADSARINGELASSCFLGAPDGSDVIDDDVDVSELIDVFPSVDDADPASMPAELIRVEADALRSMRAPFSQYVIDDAFVVTFAAAKTDDGMSTRVVRIQHLKEGQ